MSQGSLWGGNGRPHVVDLLGKWMSCVISDWPPEGTPFSLSPSGTSLKSPVLTWPFSCLDAPSCFYPRGRVTIHLFLRVNGQQVPWVAGDGLWPVFPAQHTPPQRMEFPSGLVVRQSCHCRVWERGAQGPGSVEASRGNQGSPGLNSSPGSADGSVRILTLEMGVGVHPRKIYLMGQRAQLRAPRPEWASQTETITTGTRQTPQWRGLRTNGRVEAACQPCRPRGEESHYLCTSPCQRGLRPRGGRRDPKASVCAPQLMAETHPGQRDVGMRTAPRRPPHSVKEHRPEGTRVASPCPPAAPRPVPSAARRSPGCGRPPGSCAPSGPSAAPSAGSPPPPAAAGPRPRRGSAGSGPAPSSASSPPWRGRRRPQTAAPTAS